MSFVMVVCTGMICFGETDYDGGSGSDEIYLLTNIFTEEAGQSRVRTQSTGVFEPVDQGGTFPFTRILYMGEAQDMTLAATCMEQDYGDPDALADKAHQVAEASAQAARAAGYKVPDWTPGVLAELANALFGTGDDNLGTVTEYLPIARLEQLANAPELDERGIKHKFFTYHNGEGSTYKFYYNVIR
ncbi:hypothetical protein ACFYR1_52345 [Streptomyces canus]|uniref:hypothetical protein n=1 Tax=Streptomyces canus TaxID=58343 RepID=UPI0036B4B6DB